MRASRWLPASLAILALHTAPVSAQVDDHSPFYDQHNLASKELPCVPPCPEGAQPDLDLVNPWGLTSGPTSPWWLADNGVDKSTLYNAAGVKLGLVVDVAGAPTGAVFNPGAQFVLTATNNPDGKTGTALFLFDTEEGAILAWNGTAPTTKATVVFPAAGGVSDAVYKGLAIAQFDGTNWRLYATNFRAGTVDVFDGNFEQVTEDVGFEDPTIPEGYAPFGIQTIGNVIYVTYALQDHDKEDDVAGAGHGFVNAFDLSGHWLARVASGGPLNSPWGLAWGSDSFGKFSGQLLIGNFGDGRINAFALLPNGKYQARGPLQSTNGPPSARPEDIRIDGLWALQFGKGGANGDPTQLFFTAGPDDESGGLFGFLTAAGPPGHNR